LDIDQNFLLLHRKRLGIKPKEIKLSILYSSGSSMEKTKILILAANPLDTARLGLGEEYRKIQEALELSHREDLFENKNPRRKRRGIF
jgi:hypothetical protein